jgi:isoleucyl-tRNA synthetase
MSEATTARNYKKTLNLPKTAFPMRANLAQNEPASEKRWEQMKLYDRVVAARDAENAEPFVFHDGPPYANGSIHVGHLLNKVLKDIVVRSRLMLGRQCRFVPGWDCHGLPIEYRVMTELHESGKWDKLAALSETDRRMAIRRECAKYARTFVKLQAGQMQRLLTTGDYENPYLTMTHGYEKAVLEVFAALVGEGCVYRALKPVHWSITNQTALAEAELEYMEREDLSIYVDFEAGDRDAVAKAFGVELDETPSFMIWTTTPWTLPANLAIAVHERYRYVLVRMEGNVTVVASSLMQQVLGMGGVENYDVLGEVDGSELVGLTYVHPLNQKVCPIVAADYVTLEDGTGLVHTAPGHGAEDYATGLKEGLEIYCPVQDDGTFDETVPDWLHGLSVWEANEKVTEHLRRSGHLYHAHTFMHSYPHDWRSKTPVIFRSTEQWFVSVDQPLKTWTNSLRELALNAADSEITFYPAWGRNRPALMGPADPRIPHARRVGLHDQPFGPGGGGCVR